MNKWEQNIQLVTREEIIRYCVQDTEWQAFRKRLKGIDTWNKLRLLADWKKNRIAHGVDERRVTVQVDNYINALKRGGQLDLDGNILR